MLDILIANGTVVDGSGAVGARADVAVQGDRIVEVGLLPGAEARQVIDASGQVVSPGFVDMHSHADYSLPLCPTADSFVQQGITTTVVGQCGGSPTPILDETRAEVLETRKRASRPLPWEEWSTFGSYLDYLRALGTSLNVVPLVGQGTVREAVMLYSDHPASRDQIVRMQQQVALAMDEGAIGMSSGLIYAPGYYASTDELIEVARPVGDRRGYYFSHIRGEGDTLLEAVAEAIRVGRETGASVQISHFKAAQPENWHKSALALALIDRARDEGLDVSADMYPYLAGSTGLVTILPKWAHEGGKEAILARLRSPAERQRMEDAIGAPGGYRAGRWDQVLIANCPSNRSYEGQHVAALAERAGKAPVQWVFDALLEAENDVTMINTHSTEENREVEMRHPWMMVGTDGYGLSPDGAMSDGLPHPRSYGTFPRILGRYVREKGTLSLEEAIWKMSGLPAQKLHWTDRGLVRQGQRADLVVFDPGTVRDRGTYAAPHQYPEGISAVVVNGQVVVADGAHTGARPGAILGRTA